MADIRVEMSYMIHISLSLILTLSHLLPAKYFSFLLMGGPVVKVKEKNYMCWKERDYES